MSLCLIHRVGGRRGCLSNRFTNYTLAILCALIAGSVISIMLILLNHVALGAMPEWLFDLIFGPIFTAQMMAGVGYTQRWVDPVLAEHTILDILKISIVNLTTPATYKRLWKRISEKNLGEFIGFTLGILLSIGLTTTQVVLGAHLPGVAVLHKGLSTIILFIFNTGSFSGFLGRCGRLFDYSRTNGNEFEWSWNFFKNFFAQQNVNYILGVSIGLGIGITLCVTFLAIVGASSIVSMGSVLPLWLTAGLFCLSTMGSSVGASAYMGRCVDTVIGKRTALQAFYDFIFPQPTSAPAPSIKSRLNAETTLTLIGVTIGIIVGLSLITSGITLMPFFGSGLPPLFSGIFLVALCISAAGGFGNRMGHAIDKFRLGKNPPQNTQIQPPILDPPLEPTVAPKLDCDSNEPDPQLINTADDDDQISESDEDTKSCLSPNPNAITTDPMSASEKEATVPSAVLNPNQFFIRRSSSTECIRLPLNGERLKQRSLSFSNLRSHSIFRQKQKTDLVEEKQAPRHRRILVYSQ